MHGLCDIGTQLQHLGNGISKMTFCAHKMSLKQAQASLKCKTAKHVADARSGRMHSFGRSLETKEESGWCLGQICDAARLVQQKLTKWHQHQSLANLHIYCISHILQRVKVHDTVIPRASILRYLKSFLVFPHGLVILPLT